MASLGKDRAPRDSAGPRRMAAEADGASDDPAAQPRAAAPASPDADDPKATRAEPAPSPRATLLGMSAVAVWALMAGLLKLVSMGFGPTLGVACMYTLAAAGLLVTRPPRLREVPRRYLLVGGALFVSYESVFALAVSMTTSAVQAVEVSLVNYLWPTLTVLACAAVSANPGAVGRALPGAAVATAGVFVAVGGNAGFDPAALAAHLGQNPLPYLLALAGAFVWALYSALTPKMSQGADATSLFFCGVAATLWAVFFATGAELPSQAPQAASIVALLAAALCVASGYSLWGHGLLHGDVRKMAAFSYAAPVLSTAASSLLLGVALTSLYWAGTAAVFAGSLLNWRMR